MEKLRSERRRLMQVGTHQMVSELVDLPRSSIAIRSRFRSQGFHHPTVEEEERHPWHLEKVTSCKLRSEKTMKNHHRALDKVKTRTPIRSEYQNHHHHQQTRSERPMGSVGLVPHQGPDHRHHPQKIIRSETLSCTQPQGRKGINSSPLISSRLNHSEIKQVVVPKDVVELMWKLHYLQDQGSYDEYFLNFVKIVFPLERFEDHVQVMLKNLFVNGLREDTKQYVLKSAPSTLLYAMNIATYFEDVVIHESVDKGYTTEAVKLDVGEQLTIHDMEKWGIETGKEEVYPLNTKTTTSVVLAQGLIAEGIKVVAAGANPIQIIRGIEKTAKALVAELKLMSNEVEDSELADVTVVSAGNNYEMGNMIVEAMNEVGRKGVVTLDEGKSVESSLHVMEGMQFDRGYISPYFVTDSEKMSVEYENCKLLLLDKKITNARDLINVLEDAIKGGYPIVIIVEDNEHEALATLVVNKLRGALKIATLKVPGFGECKSQYLDDIAILTGATVIRDEVGLTLDKVDRGLRGVFAPNGKLLELNDTYYNPMLACSLEAIATGGPRALYNGIVGKKFIEDMKNACGVATMEDMMKHRIEVTKADSTTEPEGSKKQIFMEPLLEGNKDKSDYVVTDVEGPKILTSNPVALKNMRTIVEKVGTSKKALLEDLASTTLTDYGVVVINGYLPSVNLKQALITIVEVLQSLTPNALSVIIIELPSEHANKALELVCLPSVSPLQGLNELAVNLPPLTRPPRKPPNITFVLKVFVTPWPSTRPPPKPLYHIAINCGHYHAKGQQLSRSSRTSSSRTRRPSISPISFTTTAGKRTQALMSKKITFEEEIQTEVKEKSPLLFFSARSRDEIDLKKVGLMHPSAWRTTGA